MNPMGRKAQKYLLVKFLFLAWIVSLSSCEFKKSTIPEKWQIDYSGKKIHELKTIFGNPNDDVSEKQFLNWIDQDGKDMKILKIICSNKCSDDEYPSQVLFYTYFNNGNRSKYIVIFDGERRVR